MSEKPKDAKKEIKTEIASEILKILKILRIEQFDFFVYEKNSILGGYFKYEIAITALKKKGAKEEVVKFEEQRLRNITCKVDLEVETYYTANGDGTIEKYFPNL